MAEPHCTQQRVISFLIQEQLSRVPQTRIHFAIFVDIRCHRPRSRFVVKVKDAALSDIDEKADILLAPDILLVSGQGNPRGF